MNCATRSSNLSPPYIALSSEISRDRSEAKRSEQPGSRTRKRRQTRPGANEITRSFGWVECHGKEALEARERSLGEDSFRREFFEKRHAIIGASDSVEQRGRAIEISERLCPWGAVPDYFFGPAPPPERVAFGAIGRFLRVRQRRRPSHRHLHGGREHYFYERRTPKTRPPRR